jgi:predicted acyl esterase
MTQERSDTWTEGTGRRQFLRMTTAGATPLALGGAGSARRSGSVENHTVRSEDGTEIAVTLYTPDVEEPTPAVLMTHGWGGFRTDPITTALALPYVDHGYAVATYDSRGFNDSGGTSQLNGEAEVADARRLIDWLATRSEVATVEAGNPRVGMDGLSYGGGIQPLVAAADSRVDAIVPRIAWNDLSYSLVPNGGVKHAWLTILLGLGAIGSYDWWEGPRLLDDLTDWYTEALERNELPDDAERAFKQRSIVSRLDAVDVPTLLIHGLNDTLFPSNEGLRTYRALQNRDVESRLMLYSGGHTLRELTVPLDSRSYMTEQTLAWMDRHLRGKDTDVPQVSTALEQRGDWRTDDQFPPAGTSTETVQFEDAWRVGDDTLKQRSVLWDPWATYHWKRPADVEIVGTPEVELGVDVHGPEARLFVRFLHEGEPINGVREAYRIEGRGYHEVQFPYPTLQRFVEAGETIGLQVSLDDPLFIDSRRSRGLTIRDEESGLRLPTRPQ